MAPKDRWDKVYADCFKDQPEGHALYKKVSVTELKPGTCGFFDEQGDWQMIADLIEPEGELYSSVSGIRRTEDPGREEWLLRKSASMYRCEPKISADIAAPALPAGGGVTVGYKTSSGQGAILVTDGNVIHTQANPSSKMCEWLKKNGKKVMENNPNAAEKGVWIVTKTYSAKRRALALLLSKDSEVTLNINALADNVGKVEATAGWWQSHVGGAWNTHDADTAIVLSMDGIYWKDRWYSSNIKPVTIARKQKFLSGDAGDAVLSPVDFAFQKSHDPNTSTVELVPEMMGKVDGVRVFDPDLDGQQEDEGESDGVDDEEVD